MDYFYMPTKIFSGHDALKLSQKEVVALGKSCLIVTSKTAAKKSGALDDVITLLDEQIITYTIFDRIMENPTVEILDEAVAFCRHMHIDFVCGIGGGSPLDASKMIAVLLNNPTMVARDLLTNGNVTSIPVIAIPTTSGTGSETTPYSIVTDLLTETKVTCQPKIFPTISILDVKYFLTMPKAVICATAIDALSHLVEGYLVNKSNKYSDMVALEGLAYFKSAMMDLSRGDYTHQMHEDLMNASMLAGMTISQTGTGIPHGMGYYLTYYHDVAHGKATGIFLASMLELYIKKSSSKTNKVLEVLNLLGFTTTSQLRDFIQSTVGTMEIRQEEVDAFAKKMYENKAKLLSHDFDITYEDIIAAYSDSCSILM